jgi:outer membrane protein assembly factor BamA
MPVINPDGSTLTDTTPIGGELFLETGAELRIPLGEWSGLMFGTTVFVDGGDVVQKEEGIDLRNLHWAAGVGIFVKYGGFKIRIDVGQRLTRTGPTELEHDASGLLKNTNFFLGVGETY